MNATFWEIFKRCDWVCFISISFWSRQFLVGIEGNLNLGVCDKIGLFLQCISLMSSRNSEEEGEKWPPGDIGIIRALAAAANPYGWSKLPKKGYEHYFLWDSYVDNRLSHPRLWFDTQFSSPKKLLYIWVFPIPIYCTHNVWKLLKMSHLNFSISAFSTNFWPIIIDLSGNTVWPKASGFHKLAKMDHFWHF